MACPSYSLTPTKMAPMKSFSDRLERGKDLLAWFQSNGGTAMVSIKKDDFGGLALLANQRLPPGSTVLSAPRNLHFTDASIFTKREIDYIKITSGINEDEFPILILALALALQSLQSHDATWQCFIGSLPPLREFNQAVIWDEDELDELGDPEIIPKVKKWNSQVRKLYATVRSIRPSLGVLSDRNVDLISALDEETLIWACLYVEGHGIQKNDRMPLSLIPIMDLINGAWKGNCNWVLSKDGSIKIRSTVELGPEEELSTTYNLHPHDFLLYIGMSPIFGPMGSIRVMVPIEKRDLKWRYNFLVDEEVVERHQRKLIVWIMAPQSKDISRFVDPTFVAFCRLVAIQSKEELSRFTWRDLEKVPLSSKVEMDRASLAIMDSIVTTNMDHFKSKLVKEEDGKRLLAYNSPTIGARRKITLEYNGVQDYPSIVPISMCFKEAIFEVLS